MIASVDFLSAVVLIAVGITIFSPLILLLLWIKDWKGNRIW